MNDTSPRFKRFMHERYAAMMSDERIRIACSMRATAMKIIASSLPEGLSREERRYAIVKRFYGSDLPEAALRAYSRYPGPEPDADPDFDSLHT